MSEASSDANENGDTCNIGVEETSNSEELNHEKQRLISQILDLQNTLDALTSKVDNVKEENLRLKSENQVLGQYIENLMSASNIFQNTDTSPTS